MSIEAPASLSGTLSSNGSLSGTITVPTIYTPSIYNGDYDVVPAAFNDRVIPTANKLLTQDMVVQKVPYYETSNVQKGITVYIAEEEN